MTSWLLKGIASLAPDQRAVAEGVAAILERLDLPYLDVAGCSAVADANGLHVTLQHRRRPGLRIDVIAGDGGEIVVSYGLEHEHFRYEDAQVGRVWPFPSEDHVGATLALVEYLLTGRIELHVWKRPLAITTRSYWINDAGQRELFLRGGTVGPFFGWSRTPEVYRFDFTESSSSV